jgi:hypothetical protein
VIIIDAIEFSLNKVAVLLLNERQYVKIIDREEKKVIKAINNPYGKLITLQMQLISNYDKEYLPYLLVRDEYNISIVDVKAMNSKKLIGGVR